MKEGPGRGLAMARDFPRTKRIEEQLLRSLAEILRREVKDPRVGPVTLTAVEVSKDLSHAKVFFLPFDQSRDAAGVREGLAAAAGFLRHELRGAMKLRHIPELRFLADETIDRAVALTSLIQQAVRTDAARHVEDEGARAPADAPPADET
jgi:ribosome-binding factor A